MNDNCDTNIPARIAYICEGDAEKDAFSGTAKSMVDHLRALGHTIYTIDVRPPKFWRILIAIKEFSLDRNRWRARFRYGNFAYQVRSAIAREKLAALSEKVDLMFQVGATFTPPGSGQIPYVVYCDWNMALSIQQSTNKLSASGGLPATVAEQINDRQKIIYKNASRIFAICEHLRESFIADYHIPSELVVRAYAGPNMDFKSIRTRILETKKNNSTILFIGKEFHRKGGEILIKAFKLVRQKIPKARLIIIGTSSEEHCDDGVEFLGKLSKAVPEEYNKMIRAFIESDVFCFPTRLEPFGIVVPEAMYFGLPCVTSDIWAMTEMVVEGETGFTVAADDYEALSKRLIEILSDSALASRLGSAGRVRAEKLFSWSSTAQIMHDHIQSVVYGLHSPERLN